MLAGGMGEIGGDAIAIRELTKPAGGRGGARARAAGPVVFSQPLRAITAIRVRSITCAACQRLIPLHAENRVIRGSAYHARCRDRMESPSGPATVTFS